MYLLDANVFIEAHRRYYGIDFAPGYWEWLERGYTTGILASVEKIFDELKSGTEQDELLSWAQLHKAMFLPIDQSVQESFRELTGWVVDPARGYKQAAKNKFLKSGDYQLIAFAHAHNHVVVTHEQPAPDSQSNVKIPDACKALGVKHTNTFSMLRAEKVRLILASEAKSSLPFS